MSPAEKAKFSRRNGAPFSKPGVQCFGSSSPAITLGCRVISAHPLRYTAATLLLNEHGANLRDVQTLLGRKSLTTTACYTHVDPKRLRSLVGNLRLHALAFSFPMSQVRQKTERVGEIAAKAVAQLFFSPGKSFTVDGLREKLRELRIPQAVRPTYAQTLHAYE